MANAQSSLTSATDRENPKLSEVRGVELANIAKVFPLRLSPFEKFILWDERPQQPMNSFIELHFESLLDEPLLEAALATAVHRNPLLACRVVERGNELNWDYDASYRPKLRATDKDPPLRGGWPVPIDLRHECGSRYWYGPTPQGSRLLVQLHHACSDGMGLRRVLIDMLTGYARSVEDANPRASQAYQDEQPASEKSERWESVSVESLLDRFDFSGSFTGPPLRKITLWQRIKNAHYFHFQLPVALAGTPATELELAHADNCEPLRHVVLSRELSDRVSSRARETNISLNELALTLLFQACCQWNRSRGHVRPSSRIRLLMPYDLRSRVDLRMPATNRLSFSFLGRSYRSCDHLKSLAASVQAEIKAIKESRLPLDFINSLHLIEKAPRLTKWGIGRSRRMATAVLTYTGDVMRGMKRHFPEQDKARLVGNARLTNILVAPPIRENTNISLGLCVNWGQICISAAWNRSAMSSQECEEFLALYSECWTQWLEA